VISAQKAILLEMQKEKYTLILADLAGSFNIKITDLTGSYPAGLAYVYIYTYCIYKIHSPLFYLPGKHA
jgi:hypothetical protein